MKTIKLKKLRLLNFKGIIDFEINFYGSSKIFGANESGKSSIYTAYLWLLTGKDEFDRKDYEIKNTNRKDLNINPHEVEAILDVDGTDHKLKRVYLEKWVKQKGESQKTFEGHKTEYWYNDVPCNATEFQARVDSLIDFKIIKLVTNPTFFNSLKWEDQRRVLISIAGDIPGIDIFKSIITPKNDYKNLIVILGAGKSIEDYKKELNAKKLLLKKTSVEFLPRIDEAKRNRPDEINFEQTEEQICILENEIKLLEQRLSDASKNLAEKQKGIMAKQTEIHQKQSQINSIRFKIKSQLEEHGNSFDSKISSIYQKIKESNITIASLEKISDDGLKNINFYKSQIDEKDAIVEDLRKQWGVINKLEFEMDESKCECPTCKQALPEDQIYSLREEMLKNFNDNNSRKKNDLVTRSNQVKSEILQCQDRIAELQKNVDNTEAINAEKVKLEALAHKMAELRISEGKKRVDSIEVATETLMRINGDALNLQDEISVIETQIEVETKEMGIDFGTEKMTEEKHKKLFSLDELKKKMAIKETIEKTDRRIAELEKEEEETNQCIAELEKEEFEISEYIKSKMDILESRVNSMFKYVKFRLFEKQVNGSVVETCVCEYNGVPYPTLNTAAKLLSGLDVLETLCNFYKIHAPVFCDNRESVSFIPEIQSQIISLFVSPEDKKIRVV